MNPTASTAYWIENTAVTPAQVTVMQFYFRFATLPTGATMNLCDNILGGIGNYGVCWQSSSGKLFCQAGSEVGAVAGPVIVTGTWYKIDVVFDGRLVDRFVNAKIDGVTLPQATQNFTVGTLADIRLGDADLSNTYDVFYDDLLVSQTPEDYPITYTVDHDYVRLPKRVLVSRP